MRTNEQREKYNRTGQLILQFCRSTIMYNQAGVLASVRCFSESSRRTSEHEIEGVRLKFG